MRKKEEKKEKKKKMKEKYTYFKYIKKKYGTTEYNIEIDPINSHFKRSLHYQRFRNQRGEDIYSPIEPILIGLFFFFVNLSKKKNIYIY